MLLTLTLVFAPTAGARAARRAPLIRAEAYAVVGAIAGPDVRVRCTITQDGVFDALGHVDWRMRRIELAPRICRRLNGLVSAAATPATSASFTQAEALLVLVHESVHLSTYEGRSDEALTECRAIQLVHVAARMLGLDDATARALGHEAMRYDAELPGPGNWMVGLHEIPSYHSPDCHDDGPLDIDPESHDWPN